MTALLKYWHWAAIAALVVALGLTRVNLADERAAHAKTKSDHALVLRDLAEKTAAVYKAVLADQQRQEATVAALDQKHTKELNDAKRSLDDFERDVRAGRRGLRVNAACPRAPTGLPETAGTSRVVDAAGPRLDDAAERDYFALRRAIDQSRAQIAGLQDYVTGVCLSDGRTPQ